MEKPHRSTLIADKYIECSKNGEIFCSDELRVLKHLVKKLQLTTPSEYARLNGVAYNTVKRRIQNGDEMVVNLNGIDLVCN